MTMNYITSKLILIAVVFYFFIDDLTTGQDQESTSNNSKALQQHHHHPMAITSMLVLPIQQKVDMKVKESVDMINQIIHSTNGSMDEYFEIRYRRAQDAYERLLNDIEQERVGANLLLEKMIANSKETVLNLQKYFADVMNSTMEKTYTDIKSILSSAVSKIDTVSRDIKETLKVNQNEPISIKDPSNGGGLSEAVKPTSLVKLFNSGIESIKKLAFKFKNEPINRDFNRLNPRWDPNFDNKQQQQQQQEQQRGKSEEKGGGKSKKLSGRRLYPSSGIISFAHEPFRPWPQLKLAHFKQLEEKSRSEQEVEMRMESAILEESEKTLETLANKLVAAQQSRKQELDEISNMETTTTMKSESSEKIVMTKSKTNNGNIFNKLMNLMTFNP